jgi:hypothetical protein
MLGKAFVRAGKRFAVILVVAMVAVSVVAYFRAGSYESYWLAFKDTMFVGGLVVMAVGGVVGAGASEFGLYNTRLYMISGNYMHGVNDDRLERRRQQFAFMIYCFALGLCMAVLPFVLP